MKIAVIDIDAILWNMADVWYEELKKVNPECPYPGKTDAWNFYEGYMTDEQFQKTVDTIHMNQDKYSCFENAHLLTKNLANAGFYIKIASHRIEDSKYVTDLWLFDNAIHYDELYTVEDKLFLLEDATVFIDDSPASQEYAVEKDVTTFSIEYPYNKHVKGIRFAKDFADLVTKVSEWSKYYEPISPSAEDTVTISADTYDKLIEDSALLASLWAAGVDNWEGYGEAINNLSYNKED